MLAHLALLLAVALPRAVAAAGNTQAAGPVVALLPLRSLGVPAEVTRALEATLRNELAALPEARLASDEAVQRELKAEPGCEEHPTCTTAMAVRVGAKELIVGTASQLGDAYMVDLKLLDARSGAELRRATHPVSGAQEVLLEALRSAAVELLAPARFAGSLRVVVPGADGAQIFVDGNPVGRAPLRNVIGGLLPGQHTLRVAREGATTDSDLFVDVRFGKTTEARVDPAKYNLLQEFTDREAPAQLIAPLPPPLLLAPLGAATPQPVRLSPLRIAGLSAVGLGLVSLTVAIVQHQRAYALSADLNRRDAQDQHSVADLGSYNQIDLSLTRARVFYGVAAGLGAVGAGLFVWDWQHESRARVEVAPGQVAVKGRF